MQISISGQHFSIGESLQEYVKNKLNDVVRKYFENAPSAHVHFSKQGYEFICDIVVNEGTGRHMVIKSNAASDEVYTSYDIASAKLEKQLRKYKSKLKDRNSRVKLSEIGIGGTKYVISSNQNFDEMETDVDNPLVIAEKSVDLLKLSVGEAVMKMDLENLPALMFQNSKTERMNVVYYRKDGNISWVDSN